MKGRKKKENEDRCEEGVKDEGVKGAGVFNWTGVCEGAKVHEEEVLDIGKIWEKV